MAMCRSSWQQGWRRWDLCTAAEAYGAVTCLVKPIELDELIWHIEMALAVRQNAAPGGGDLTPEARRCNPDRTPA